LFESDEGASSPEADSRVSPAADSSSAFASATPTPRDGEASGPSGALEGAGSIGPFGGPQQPQAAAAAAADAMTNELAALRTRSVQQVAAMTDLAAEAAAAAMMALAGARQLRGSSPTAARCPLG
jgi:hypothetical protein